MKQLLEVVPRHRRFDTMVGLALVVAVVLNLSILSLRDDAADFTATARAAELVSADQTVSAPPAENVGSGALVVSELATGSMGTEPAGLSADPAPTPSAAPTTAAPSAAPTTAAPGTPSPSTGSPTAGSPTTVSSTTASPTTAPVPISFEVEDFATVFVTDRDGVELDLVRVDTADGWGFRVEKLTPSSMELKFRADGEDEVKWTLGRRSGRLIPEIER